MTVVQNDVLRVTAELSFGADDLQNTFHYQYTSVADATDAEALDDIANIMDDLYSIIVADMSSSVDFDQVRVQNVTQDVLLGAAAWPSLVSGTEASAALPLQVAALITYTTAVPKTRGGTYFGGMTEIANGLGGTIVAATVVRLAELAVEALLEQTIKDRTYQFILRNRLLGTIIPFTTSIIHSVFRTQRRRRQGVGS